MSRILTVAAAQSGPIARDESRELTLERRIAQLHEASRQGCDLVVFPECALTAFFPHWYTADEAEVDDWYERQMPGPNTRRLFDEAARLRIGFCLGYCELAVEAGVKRRFNSCLLVERDGRIVGKYRKIHLPGHSDHRPADPFQNLEKLYFEVGNLGFPTWRAFGGVVGMMICNDRRWAEAYRVLGLGGAEIVLCGYNTPDNIPGHHELDRLVNFHNRLSMQAGAYQNGCWVVGVAKAGVEEGVSMIGDSVFVAPSGEIAAASATMGDELLVHQCDLDAVKPYKEFVFNFALHRRIEHYGLIAKQTGVVLPGER